MNTSAISIPRSPRFQVSRCSSKRARANAREHGKWNEGINEDCHFPSSKFAHFHLENILPPFLRSPFVNLSSFLPKRNPTLLLSKLLSLKTRRYIARSKKNKLINHRHPVQRWLASFYNNFQSLHIFIPVWHRPLINTRARVNARFAYTRGPCRLITPAHYPATCLLSR